MNAAERTPASKASATIGLLAGILGYPNTFEGLLECICCTGRFLAPKAECQYKFVKMQPGHVLYEIVLEKRYVLEIEACQIQNGTAESF